MDIGGQERFDFFRDDFFEGASVIALIFDLARPDTLEMLEKYYNAVREKAGNIPIILVGNKKDLEKELGILIKKKYILDISHRYNLLEYIETSALTGLNIKKLFNKMAFLALLDLQSPSKLGQIIDRQNFRFKIVLAGPAAVGKTTILRTFVDKDFTEQYKLTVGIDVSSQIYEIPDEDLSNEVKESIGKAFISVNKFIKEQNPKKIMETIEIEDNLDQNIVSENHKLLSRRKRIIRNFTLIGLIFIIICILIAFLNCFT